MLPIDQSVELTEILQNSGFRLIEDPEHLEFYCLEDERTTSIIVTHTLLVTFKSNGIILFEKQAEDYSELKRIIDEFLPEHFKKE